MKIIDIIVVSIVVVLFVVIFYYTFCRKKSSKSSCHGCPYAKKCQKTCHIDKKTG